MSAGPSQTETDTFQILYKADGPFNDDNCYLVSVEEFDEHVAKPHPQVDRASLKWDASIIWRDVFMYWKQVGVKGWYLGKITAYDPNSQEHTIVWDDGSEDWSENLLAIRKVEEWRFVQPGEDVDVMLK